MTDTELADALVALGIVSDWRDEYVLGIHPDTDYYTLEEVVRDWRVAGVVMERCHETTTIIIDGIHISPWIRTYGLSEQATDHEIGESLPRAIIEAGVAALGAK